MANETVLVGEFSHETNTFAVRETDREAFADRREDFGNPLIENLRGTNTPVGGIVDAAESAGLDLLPTVAAAATPGGAVTADAYEAYAGEILSTARERGDDVDGVALSLHGAMVPEGRVDGEGPLLAGVREAVGPDVPVVATLDLHGNVTDRMCEAADALVAFLCRLRVDGRLWVRHALPSGGSSPQDSAVARSSVVTLPPARSPPSVTALSSAPAKAAVAGASTSRSRRSAYASV